VPNQLKVDALNQKTVPTERFMQPNQILVEKWAIGCGLVMKLAFTGCGFAGVMADKKRE
jgi:hypothetical protein